MQQQLQDTDIIASVLQGRKQDYALLVARYQHFVFTIALRYIPAREDAEELAQDVFVKAYRSLADYKAQSKFSTWLYTITHRSCISFLRKKKLTVLSADNEKMAVIAENIAGSNTTENNSQTKTHKQVLNECIGLLPVDDAEAITLFYLAEQSIEEIGIIMGLETNNIKVKLHRARQKLRAIVEKRYGAEAPLLYRN